MCFIIGLWYLHLCTSIWFLMSVIEHCNVIFSYWFILIIYIFLLFYITTLPWPLLTVLDKSGRERIGAFLAEILLMSNCERVTKSFQESLCQPSVHSRYCQLISNTRIATLPLPKIFLYITTISIFIFSLLVSTKWFFVPLISCTLYAVLMCIHFIIYIICYIVTDGMWYRRWYTKGVLLLLSTIWLYYIVHLTILIIHYHTNTNCYF